MDLEDELLNLIGHKLRQNLINVAELSTLVLADGGSAMPHAVRSDVAQIRTQAEEALSTIDDILRLARSCYTPGTVATISFDSIMSEVIPRCAQKVFGNTLRLYIASAISTIGIVQADITALEYAINKVFTVLNDFRPNSAVHCSANIADMMVTLNFQTSPNQNSVIFSSIKDVFKEVRDVKTLIEMLTCLRLVRVSGGQIDVLSANNEETGLGIRVQLPISF